VTKLGRSWDDVGQNQYRTSSMIDGDSFVFHVGEKSWICLCNRLFLGPAFLGRVLALCSKNDIWLNCPVVI
jgi:hypothetical protein